MAKILLINPSMEELYSIAKVKSSVPKYIPLNLLTIAAPLIENGHKVIVLDLNLVKDLKESIRSALEKFRPDMVGITFTTPLYSQTMGIASFIKSYDRNVTVIAGGVHITSDYMAVLHESEVDIAVIGEGDFKLLDILGAKSLSSVKGIAYKNQGRIVVNEREPYIKDLDIMPFPALELVSIKDYEISHTYCRKNPVFPLETSRGCVYGCVYCNKSVFGRNFRVKSAGKVISELKRIKGLGFKEVHIIDDGFTTDMKRAKEICRLIIQEKIDLLFNCPNGIRADRIDLELLILMKKAGFYRVAFGVETGSQKILDAIGKDMKMESVVNAFRLCRKVGLETTAFFMFGLPEETETDMKRTIRFAKRLRPDIAKFDIMIPLPSTPIYEEWKRKGYIKSNNWDDYGFYKEEKIYDHPNLSWETLTKYLNYAYRSFYLSPGFLTRRFFVSLRNRTLLKDARLFFSTKW